MNDEQLISRVLTGDMQAYTLLIRRHERIVGHMISRVVKNAEEVEELAQDVFMKVYQNLSGFNGQSKLSTWIATIAYRHALNHLRKNKMSFTDIPEEESFSAHFVEEENPETELEGQDMDQFVLALVEQLPPQYKIIINLYHMEHMTYPEICEITNLPEGTVKSYLFRARLMLKEKVKKIIGKEEWL